MNESPSELAPSPALPESHRWPHPDLAASPAITSSLAHVVTALVHNHRCDPLSTLFHVWPLVVIFLGPCSTTICGSLVPTGGRFKSQDPRATSGPSPWFSDDPGYYPLAPWVAPMPGAQGRRQEGPSQPCLERCWVSETIGSN